MRILAIVVTYHPEKDLLEKNISAFIEHVDKLLIWENTPEHEKLYYRFIHNDKVEYCGDGVNSISRALNYAWRFAVDNGYDYLLTMDQDSQWVDFKSFLSKTIDNPEVPRGIWGPDSSGSDNYKDICRMDILITSGMLIETKLINIIGGWNEFFKIDCVDDEFCLRARSKGVNTYMFGGLVLNQRFGIPRIARLLGHEAKLRNDSPKRLYSIYKNHVLLLRLFPEVKSIRKDFKVCWLPQIKWIFVFENDRFRKLFAIIRGIISGLTCDISKARLM